MQWEKDFRKRHPEKVFQSDVSEPNFEGPIVPVDIGFNDAGHESHHNEVAETFGVKATVSLETVFTYKYLIVIDGNSWPSRIQYYLQADSVILYPRLFIDWYTWKLEPFIHFVPLKLDFSDLEEKLQWLEENQDAAEKIIQNAHYLLSIFNNHNQMQCHTAFAMAHIQEYLIK